MERAPALALRWSNSPPGRGVSARAKVSGAASTAAPSRRSSATRPSTPGSGLAASTWKWRHSVSPVMACRAAASTRSGRRRIGRERPGREHGKAGQRQALGAAHAGAACGIAPGPVGPRAGVQEHADRRQIEGRPRPLGRIAPFRRRPRSPSSGPRRPPRNGASASGTARPGWDRRRALSRSRHRRRPPAWPDRCGSDQAAPPAQAPAADARAPARRGRSKAKGLLPIGAA